MLQQQQAEAAGSAAAAANLTVASALKYQNLTTMHEPMNIQRLT
jgi:hypothetical protein